MPLVDLTGAWDLHIHSNPSLFTRTGNDLDMARHAQASGLAGILIKNHFESTVGRAYLATCLVDGVRVYGGLVLNHFTGGLNPTAVENALGLGAKQIWMPTLDAEAHAKTFGHTGGFGYQESGQKIARPGISVLDDTGQLSPDVKIIVELVRDAGAILGTAHLRRDEIFAMAVFARDAGMTRLLVTHPYFNPPDLCLEDQRALTEMGAFLELCGGNLYPIPGVGRIDNYRATVAKVGAKSIVLSSDAGQPRKSMPAEVLRIFGQCLMEKGVTQSEIDLMCKENPASLLGV